MTIRELKLDQLSSALTEQEKVLLIEALRYYAKSPMRPSSILARRIRTLQALLAEAI